jgi:hypothetical protein
MRLSPRRAAHVVVASGAKQEIRGRAQRNVLETLAVVVSPVMVVAVIFMIPVALMVGPSTVIAVVVAMGPISAGIGRSAPHSGDPDISAPVPVPISVDPRVTRTRHPRPYLVTKGWRLMTNVNTNLGKRWSGNC